MKCPKCKQEGLVAIVKIIMEMDAGDSYAINKKTMRKPSTIILGVEKGKINYNCPHCHWNSRDIIHSE